MIRSIIFTLLLVKINGLYEDQAGKFDWKKTFIGKPTHASIENNKIHVLTDENVLACLNAKNGEIQWRQVLETDQTVHFFKLIKRGIVTVTGNHVRGWEPTTGTIQWEWLLPSLEHSFLSIYQDKLVRIVDGNLEMYNVESGAVLKKSKLEFEQFKETYKCALNGLHFGCITKHSASNVELSFITINSMETWSESFEFNGESEPNLLEFEAEIPTFSVIRDNQARILRFNKNSVEVLPEIHNSNVVNINSEYFELDINIHNPDKLLQIKTSSGRVFDVEYPRGLGAPYILTGNAGELLLVTIDHTLIFLKLNTGKIEWTREESLVNIVACEFFELPVSEHDASIENEFETTTNVLSMFLHRISTQFKQLSFGTSFKNNYMVRDDFGLHKIIVIVTKVGKLFGIDTISGGIVWTYRLPHFTPFEQMLLVQRTSRYAPINPPQCTLLGQDVLTGATVAFQFDPITGKSAKGAVKIKKSKLVMLLEFEDEEHLKPFITIHEDGSVGVYPETSKGIVAKHASSIYFYIIEDDGVNGYGLQIKNEEIRVELRWNFTFKPGKLAGVSLRPPGERVHSQGRVLPDRSVYYKYVNPNLIALAVISEDTYHKTVLSVYLLDGITGFVVHSVAHKRARGPVNLAHSENWLVYTFFNEKYRRTELVSLELYEGHVQSNSSVFSSFAMSQLPQIQTQSYILPSTPLKLTVTLTERGITNKCILVALNNGNVMEIPWGLIQPRFADIPCGPEESCYPYMPELPIQPEAMINYNKTLGSTKGITVAPARLESTSHVLVHGLDMFYTRIAPSKTFDVLKEDFDHKLILLVLLGFVVASYVTRLLAARKALKQAWK